MKKVLSALIFLCMIFSANCQAADYYVGTFKDGYNAYLITDRISGIYNLDTELYKSFHCIVKAVKRNDIIYIDYDFWRDNGDWYFSNSQGFNKKVTTNTPVANNLINYLLNVYGK